jgi:L-cysteine/cystine lyase
MMSAIDQHRQHFPYVDRYTYFNYGGQGLLPQKAIDALQDSQTALQAMAPFCTAAHAWMAQETETLRSLIAAELGAPAHTISLTEDTTVGCNIALWGIDWQPGDRVLMSDCEHQGIIATLEELRHRFGIEIDICPLRTTLGQDDPAAVIAAALTPKTRMLVISHVLWNTGQVLPLESIVAVCRSANVWVMVDAAQSVGMLPLNLTELGADFYAFTGHKWWGGPQGVGGLYIRPESQPALRPTFIGWRSVDLDATGKPTGFKTNSERYEVATSSIAAYMGLTATLQQHRHFGSSDERYRLIVDRATELWQQLNTLPQINCLLTTPPRSGLVAFKIASGKHAALVSALESRQIFTRLLLDPNCVRACTHYFSTSAEVDHLVEAIAQLA